MKTMPFHRKRRGLLLAGVAVLAPCVFGPGAPAGAATILFVGNSFTYGEPAGGSPKVKQYRPDTVTDLNGTGIGGVPALFKAFTVAAGLQYDVSLETVGGVGLDYHYNNKYAAIVKPFDKVVLQSYSTLDATKPGNPDLVVQYTALLAQALRGQNPQVDIRLDATWSRPDLTYKQGAPWYGQSIYQMALDVRAGYDKAAQAASLGHPPIPVGQAFNGAIAAGLADANPYDGIDAGKFDLWAPDHYHASASGYYLEALTIFGSVTGLDPRLLGGGDPVAKDIGIDGATAAALQRLAAEQLGVGAAVREPTQAETRAAARR